MSENGFRERIGIRDYHISQEEKEILEGWKKEIQKIVDIFSIRPFDREKIGEFIGSTFKRGESKLPDIGPLLDKIEIGEMTEEQLTVASISVWVLMKKGKWTVGASTVKPFLGGTFTPSEFLEKKGKPNCIDTSELARQLAEEFGIRGSIETIGMSAKLRTLGAGKRGHHFYQTELGTISDVWLGRDQGGYFDDILELVEKGKVFGDCK